MTWLPLALWVVLFLPFLREAVRPTMTARRRTDAPGEFAKLSQGVTHYRWLGADDGPVAVCVHGLTTPCFVWNAVARGLGGMGFRVLVYDLYGRGYSDRPRGVQDCAFFVRQLSDLLADQGVCRDITLLGYSMGGAIAPAFAAKHPQMLRQLVLIAPAGLGHDLGPASRLLANTGLVGRWAMLSVYGRSMRRALDAERNQEPDVPGIVDMQIAELRYRGFLPAILSSLRGIMEDHMEDTHRAVAAQRLPVLAVWGAEDDIIPITGKQALSDWNAAARHAVIEGAGHNLTFTRANAVIDALRNGLSV